MKYISRILSLAVLLTLLVSSCNTESDNPTVTEQSFPGFFANVHEMSTGATAVYNNISYKVTLNYDELTAEVQITGLKLPDGTTYPTMTLSGLRWGIDTNGWREITGAQIVPSIGGFSNAPTFTQFKFRIYERFVDSNGTSIYSPAVCATYIINGLYKVMSSFSPQMLYGTTVATDTENNRTLETTNTPYSVTYNTDTRTMTINMGGVRFSTESSESYDIEVRNIPLTTYDDKLSFDVATIIPYLSGSPFEKYPFSNLKGNFNPAEGLTFSFDTTERTTNITYHVEVKCDFSRINSYN
mgnify:CR=1 FL=1